MDPKGLLIFVWTKDNNGLFPNFLYTSPEGLYRVPSWRQRTHRFEWFLVRIQTFRSNDRLQKLRRQHSFSMWVANISNNKLTLVSITKDCFDTPEQVKRMNFLSRKSYRKFNQIEATTVLVAVNASFWLTHFASSFLTRFIVSFNVHNW